MTTETISVASLSNTSGLSDLLNRLSEGKEIVWATHPGGEFVEVKVQSTGEKGHPDDIVIPRQDRKVVAPLLASRPLRRRPKHHSALTDKRLGMVSRLWSIVLSKAYQSGLAVSGEIGVEESVEDEANQVVLAVHVDGNAKQALAFWKSLDVDMDRWLTRLPAYDQRLVMNNVGLRFSWVD